MAFSPGYLSGGCRSQPDKAERILGFLISRYGCPIRSAPAHNSAVAAVRRRSVYMSWGDRMLVPRDIERNNPEAISGGAGKLLETMQCDSNRCLSRGGI